MKNLLVIVFAIFFVISCAKNEEKKVTAGKGDQLTKAENIAGDGGNYLARVGDTIIMQQDVDNEFALMPKDRLRFYAGEDGKDRLLGEMVKKEMLYLEAIDQGIDKKQEYLMKIEYLKKMALIEMLLETKLHKKMEITDKEVIAYYNRHKATEFTDKATGKVIELQEIKEMLRKQLAIEKQQEVFDGYMADLIKKYEPVIK